MAESEQKEVTSRDESGRFVPGISGNPKGRPLGAKNRIVQLKQDLELLIREEIVKPDDVREVWNKLVDEAKLGNVSAAKYILDKVMSQATSGEDVNSQGGGFTIKVQNLTLAGSPEPEAVDGEYEEIP